MSGVTSKTIQWELIGELIEILYPLEVGTTYLCSEATSSLSIVTTGDIANENIMKSKLFIGVNFITQ